MQNNAQQTKNSATDSLFGMMLVSAFIGVAYGPNAEAALKGAEATSSVYEDRQPSFKLGVKNSLAGAFARETQDWKSIMQPLQAMRPSRSPSFAF